MQSAPDTHRDRDAATRRWPAWPRASAACGPLLLEALESARWTVRGAYTRGDSLEERFARRFAAWHSVAHCVPVCTGTAGLILALEALDLGPGDEVIVPVLGWPAPATAVLSVGATPVPVDVDGESGCLHADAVARACTPSTRAVIAVHLHSTVVDLEPLLAVSAERDVHVIEDCAQAIGAQYGGRMVGAWGAIGCFSVNQEKVLAAGEGGVVITGDHRLAERLHGLRADGMRYDPDRRIVGEDVFDGFCGVMGSSCAMSEFVAAVALGQLDTLEEEIARRDENARRLDAALHELPWFVPLRAPAALTRRSVYEYGVRVRRDRVRADVAALAVALTEELGFPVHETDPPLHLNPIFAPASKRRFALNQPRWAAGGYPEAERLCNDLLVFPHSVLLAEPSIMTEIAAAFARVGRRLGD